MKWIAKTLLASLILPSALMAKGLDKLQPATADEPRPDDKEKDYESAKGAGKAAAAGGVMADGNAAAAPTAAGTTDPDKRLRWTLKRSQRSLSLSLNQVFSAGTLARALV